MIAGWIFQNGNWQWRLAAHEIRDAWTNRKKNIQKNSCETNSNENGNENNWLCTHTHTLEMTAVYLACCLYEKPHLECHMPSMPWHKHDCNCVLLYFYFTQTDPINVQLNLQSKCLVLFVVYKKFKIATRNCRRASSKYFSNRNNWHTKRQSVQRRSVLCVCVCEMQSQ